MAAAIRLNEQHSCSFDDLVGEREQLVRHVEAECLGPLEVDDQLELGWLHDRKVGWLGSCDDPAGIHANLAVCIKQVRTVADEATGCDKLAAIVNPRNFVSCDQGEHPSTDS